MLLEDGEPRIQMVLVIDEYTNFDSISRNRKAIKDLFGFLNSQQGNDLNYKYMDNLYALIQWHKEGNSWRKLTMFLNYLGFALTFSAYDESQNKEEPATKLGKSQDSIIDPSFVTNFGGAGLMFIFLALGMTLKDFNSWMEQGYELLAEDRFDLEILSNPFSKQRVIDQVRYFQHRIDENIIAISEDNLNWNELEHTIYILIRKGNFPKLDELLDKEGLADWKRNKLFLQNWIVKISEKWASSQDPKINKMRELYKDIGKS
jgi:hypothetical protein